LPSKTLFATEPDLAHINSALTALRERTKRANQVVDPEVIENQIMTERTFKHLWSEYRETLHSIKDVVDGEASGRYDESSTAGIGISVTKLI